MKIAVLSDTHGLLRPAVLERIAGAELILHAGDVGGKEILDSLRSLAPVRVVRGNIDKGAFGAALPPSEHIRLEGGVIHMVHNLADLSIEPAREGIRLVVYGHSHVPACYAKEGVTYLNPGSVGPRRFKLPISLALVDWSEENLECALIALDP